MQDLRRNANGVPVESVGVSGDWREGRPRIVPRIDLVRDVHGPMYLETFLVSAVAAILGIRLYLELSGYPRLGPGGLHIAHMLWGGLLMLIALVLLLAFLGRRVKQAAAVAGGVGFGAFIDELGKFLTSDNDYFYRPTIGMIYVILIGLFLIFRQIARHRELTRIEVLTNAAAMLPEIVIDGAQSTEIGRALALLDRSGYQTELARAIREAVLDAERVPESSPSLPSRIASGTRRLYSLIVGLRWFQRAIVLTFTANAAASVIAAISSVSSGSLGGFSSDDRSFATLAQLAGSAAASAVTIVGVVLLARSRLAAYQWFKRSVLITIFFVQVFLFFESQLAALSGLVINLVMLAGLNAMLSAERVREERSRVVSQHGRPLAGTITRAKSAYVAPSED